MIHPDTPLLCEKYNAEGYELRMLQLKMLAILKEVTSICDAHAIPYWLSGGTLLGARRHGGFIPWDDDIDIELLRKDYLRLLEILPKELSADLHLQTPSEKSNRLLFSKVRDRFSVVHAEEEDMSTYEVKGIFIDLFPEERGYKWMKNIVDFFYGRSFRRLKRGRPFHSLRYFFEYIISIPMYMIGWSLMWLARGICAITRPNTIVHSYGIGNTTKHNATYMFPLATIEFEGQTFSAPKNTDAYLRKQYGDFMHIPPEDKRMTHFLKVTYL